MKLPAASLWRTHLVQQRLYKKQCAFIVSKYSSANSTLTWELSSDCHSRKACSLSSFPSATVTHHSYSSINNRGKEKRFYFTLNSESAENSKESNHHTSSSKFGQWLANAVAVITVIIMGGNTVECKTFDQHSNENPCNCCSCSKKSKLDQEPTFAYPAECSYNCQNFSHLPQEMKNLFDGSLCAASSDDVCSHCNPDKDYHPAVQLDATSLKNLQNRDSLEAARKEALELLKQTLTVTGATGLTVAVAVDGMLVWCIGIGPCNLESGEGCYCDSLYRIASISKPITAALAMALWEDGMLDLDKPLRHYLGEEWPIKTVDGEQVDITTRQLLSHTSGLRHYNLSRPKSLKSNNDDKEKTKPQSRSFEELQELLRSSPTSLTPEEFDAYVAERRRRMASKLSDKPFRDMKRETSKMKREKSDLFEYYINKPCNSVKEAIELFKDDDLFFKPGTDFLYTSHGYTLLSRVLEIVTGKSFPDLARSLFLDMGMGTTGLDRPEDIHYGRVPMYVRDQNHILRNVPHVDNSYKWAGGGFLSSAVDLTKFGSAMLYSFQNTHHHIASPAHRTIPGYLRSATVRQMWSPHWFQPEGQALPSSHVQGYGLGWCLKVPRPDTKISYHGCRNLYRRSNTEDNVPTASSEGEQGAVLPPPPMHSPDVGAAAASNKQEESNTSEKTGQLPTGNGRVTVDCSSASLQSCSCSSATLQSCSCTGTTINGIIKCSGSASPTNCSECPQTTVTNDTNSNVGGMDAAEPFHQHQSPLMQSSSAALRNVNEPEWVTDTTVAGRSHRAYTYVPGFMAYHTGAAVGGSSVLLVAPRICATWKIERLDEKGEVAIGGEGKLAKQESTVASSEVVSRGKVESTAAGGGKEVVAQRSNDAEDEKIRATDAGKGGNCKGTLKKKGKVHRRAVLREPTVEDCPLCRKKYKPRCPPARGDQVNSRAPPGGVVVSIVTNHTGINFTKDAMKIAEIFRNFRSTKDFSAHNMPTSEQ